VIVRWFAGCRVTDNKFVQLIEALKVNTTSTKIDLGGTFKLCRVCFVMPNHYF